MKLLLTTTILTAAFTLLAAMPLTAKQRVSVHDPSVVYDQATGRYYIFGSHKAGAFSTDMQNWTVANPTWQPDNNATAFTTPAVKTVKKGGVEVSFPQFNAADWSGRNDASFDINGNMWAPDVIWNTSMQKWCMYLSVNGNAFHSSIILLTADNIVGPYVYQGPVITCGFYDAAHGYKETDMELALGTLSSLPTRYNVGDKFGTFWPHTIDPCVFYDEDGKLWMSYGSWFGGIWMLELDEETGLRDYDVTYPSQGGASYNVATDGYFGKKIAGGYSVSGEGSYIRHIGQYYYLFVSYGEFAPNGGYQMRVFRSATPDGPYVDSRGVSAVYSGRATNYGLNCDTRGEKLMGAYNNWGEMTVGECSQGHNSIIVAPDGRNYLVYHTKFNNATVGHEVRVHQVFVNEDGWLVAAPFEYNGETVTDHEIATSQPFTTDEIAGSYSLLVHQYSLNHKTFEEEQPVSITLTADGQVTGSLTGTWDLTSGTGYISLTLGDVTYKGVLFGELMDYNSLRTISFTACASATGVNIWGYKQYPNAPVDDWYKGMVAHYGFDDSGLANTFNKTQQAKLLKNGDNSAPELVQLGGHPAGSQVSLNFGVNANESYVQMPNPLNGLTLSEGATLSFWVKRADANAWDALFGFMKGDARLYMTGNSYVGYNDYDGNWVDLNHPSAIISDNIAVGSWQLVTLTVSRQDIALYVNGAPKTFATCNGEMAGSAITRVEDFDYGHIVDLLASADQFYLGRGSFWGSAQAAFDDVIVYNRPLSADEAYSLYMMELQQFDFALLQEEPVDDWYKGMVAHYGFDDEALANTYNDKQQAQLMTDGEGVAPQFVEDGGWLTGRQVSLCFGANGNESYVQMPNPLLGRTLSDGATLSFWVKRADANAWDALFGFMKGDARLYMTGNNYVGYNGFDGYWVDLNHPSATISDNIAVGSWQLVTLTVSRQDIIIYVNGVPKTFATCNGEMAGSAITRVEDFDYGHIVDLLASADQFYLGRGSFWGSAPAAFDDVIVYNRPLSADEVHSLYMMECRHFNFASIKDLLPADVPGDANGNGVVDSSDLSTAVTRMLEGSYLETLDMNGDSRIDIVDIVRIIEQIRNK